jgi:hypothetical protein
MIEAILFCFWSILAFYGISKLHVFNDGDLRNRTWHVLFTFKLIFGAILLWVYTYYYANRSTADVYKFYDDAAVISSSLQKDPIVYFKFLFGWDMQSEDCKPYWNQLHNWAEQSQQWLDYAKTESYNYFNANRLITRIHAVLIPLSSGFIFTHLIFFNFFILLSFAYFYKAYSAYFSRLAWVLFFLMPSTLFWCSGLLKDTLVLAFICFYFYFFKNVFNHNKISWLSVLACLMSLLALLYTKFYILSGIGVFSILAIIFKFFTTPKSLRISAVFFVICLLLITTDLGSPIRELLCGKREEALKAAVFGEAQHQIFYHNISADPMSVLYEIPKTFFDAFFQPILWSGRNIMLMLSTLENIFLFLLFIYFLVMLRKQKQSTNLLPFWGFILTLAFVIGFTSPVTGGLIRYKTAYLPFFVLIIGNHTIINSKLIGVRNLKLNSD